MARRGIERADGRYETLLLGIAGDTLGKRFRGARVGAVKHAQRQPSRSIDSGACSGRRLLSLGCRFAGCDGDFAPPDFDEETVRLDGQHLLELELIARVG